MSFVIAGRAPLLSVENAVETERVHITVDFGLVTRLFLAEIFWLYNYMK